MSVEETAAQAAAGAVAGTVSGAMNAAAPHLRRVGRVGFGAFNIPSAFFNGTVKSLRTHHKLTTALGAGTAAVIANGAVATAVVAAAPVVLGAAAVGGAIFGTVKLVEHLREKA